LNYVFGNAFTGLQCVIVVLFLFINFREWNFEVNENEVVHIYIRNSKTQQKLDDYSKSVVFFINCCFTDFKKRRVFQWPRNRQFKKNEKFCCTQNFFAFRKTNLRSIERIYTYF